MPVTDPATLTERQRAWFAAIREGLERETGRTLEQWIEIARACPETRHRARLKWMKDEHGLGQNRASLVLNEAFPAATGWSTPDALADTLWADPSARAILEAARAVILELPDIVIGQRKTYTAFSRAFQFAALRPAKGAVLLGLAVPPDAAPGLVAPKRVVWSERLTSEVSLADAAEIGLLRPLLQQAWNAS
jgi:hypothetical protein